jgi:hypothetical protein
MTSLIRFAMLESSMAQMQHEKKTDELVLGKLQRERKELAHQIVQLTEEIKREHRGFEKLNAQLSKRADEVKHLELHVKILEAALEAGGVSSPHTFPLEKKGSSRMNAIMAKAMRAKAKELGAQPAASSVRSGGGGGGTLEMALAGKAKESNHRAEGSAAGKSLQGSSPSVLSPSMSPAALRKPSTSTALHVLKGPTALGTAAECAPADVPAAVAAAAAAGADEGVRRVFAWYDSDGSGSIDLQELRAALMELRLDAATLGLSAEEWEEQLSAIVRKYDADGNGTLELGEFALLVGDLRGDETSAVPGATESSAAPSAVPGADEFVPLIRQLYEAEELVKRAHSVDEFALRAEIASLEEDMYDVSCAYVEAYKAATSARARGRWARACGFVCRERNAIHRGCVAGSRSPAHLCYAADHWSVDRLPSPRRSAAIKWAVAVAASRNAELRNQCEQMRAAKEIEKAYHRASMARESSENLAVRSEALAEQNKSLAAAHSGLVATAEEQRQRLEWLEQRLSASAVHVDAQAERATQVALERSARLEAELWKLKWQLEQSEEDKEQQAQKLRKTTEEQHSLGASHAQLVKQHADDVARLHQAEAEAERLRDEVGELRSSIALDCTGLHGIGLDWT